ncbi:hypothetical protein OE88DRAFT_1037973 [Heliocybe sulcata]|uniref:Cyanovirin-N domain-containing protein n=1 Tax=Heliocybe sulcata TaxID=5364 RepID=A0A5C3MLH1_9AGAM|nr:hypothetical protein OE88DRAFT_1037973 [Heliocybe sulcata]
MKSSGLSAYAPCLLLLAVLSVRRHLLSGTYERKSSEKPSATHLLCDGEGRLQARHTERMITLLVRGQTHSRRIARCKTSEPNIGRELRSLRNGSYEESSLSFMIRGVEGELRVSLIASGTRDRGKLSSRQDVSLSRAGLSLEADVNKL